jgi:hypothetical protein
MVGSLFWRSPIKQEHTLVVGTPTSTFSKDEGFAAGVSMKLISLARLPVVVAILMRVERALKTGRALESKRAKETKLDSSQCQYKQLQSSTKRRAAQDNTCNSPNSDTKHTSPDRAAVVRCGGAGGAPQSKTPKALERWAVCASEPDDQVKMRIFGHTTCGKCAFLSLGTTASFRFLEHVTGLGEELTQDG